MRKCQKNALFCWGVWGSTYQNVAPLPGAGRVESGLVGLGGGGGGEGVLMERRGTHPTWSLLWFGCISLTVSPCQSNPLFLTDDHVKSLELAFHQALDISLGHMPHEVSHVGIWAIHCSKPRQNGHQRYTDDPNTTDALLDGQDPVFGAQNWERISNFPKHVQKSNPTCGCHQYHGDSSMDET